MIYVYVRKSVGERSLYQYTPVAHYSRASLLIIKTLLFNSASGLHLAQHRCPIFVLRH